MLKEFSITILVFYLHLGSCHTDDIPRVEINNDEFKGFIVGKKFQDSKVNYMGFRGIPYAKAPINELRFKDPQKLDKFEGTLDATNDGFECWSITALNASEDCLNLNVYTKQLKPAFLPVIVLIHPGGLYIGSGASYNMNPSHMMLKDIVLVTFNYRLGSLGFLNVGTSEIPGNAGLKDQVFALRWVKKYIQHFGGNPKDITLMGYSAGALSVHFHLLSPMSKDIFHKAIIMSGSMPPQAYLPQGQQKYLAVRQAKRLGCEKFHTVEEEIPYGVDRNFSDYKEIRNEDILECLNQHNASAIANTLRKMFDFFKDNPLILWMPVVEQDFHQERFLTEKLKVAPKSLLIGYTNGEFCLSSKEILEKETSRNKFNKEFKDLAPRAFSYERHFNRDNITAEIRKKYFNDSTELTHKDEDALCDLFSDSWIRFGSHKLAEILTKRKSDVYFYEFVFVGNSNIPHDNDGFPDKQVRCEHLDDFQYLFNWTGRKHDTEQQLKIVKLYTDFIYDFVKNGKLTDDNAKPYPQSYALIKDYVEYINEHNFRNYEFWTKLFPNYFNYKLE